MPQAAGPTQGKSKSHHYNVAREANEKISSSMNFLGPCNSRGIISEKCKI